MGKYAFCRQLITNARQLGVRRIFTFAAMATPMHPSQHARLFGAAMDLESLDELKRLEFEILKDGHIGGLNGVLLGAAAEANMRGACLLGEMPHVFTQLPFPKSLHSRFRISSPLAGIELDLTELAETTSPADGATWANYWHVWSRDTVSSPKRRKNTPRIAGRKPGQRTGSGSRPFSTWRWKNDPEAFELKQELDRLGLFKAYEDRFLDLFKKPG